MWPQCNVDKYISSIIRLTWLCINEVESANVASYSDATFLFHFSFVKCHHFVQPYFSSLFEDAEVPELWFVNEIQDGMKEGRQTELVTVCDSTCP